MDEHLPDAEVLEAGRSRRADLDGAGHPEPVEAAVVREGLAGAGTAEEVVEREARVVNPGIPGQSVVARRRVARRVPDPVHGVAGLDGQDIRRVREVDDVHVERGRGRPAGEDACKQQD